MENVAYNAYKGLQKPLVFKFLKGKYIYWSLGILVGSMVLGIITIVALSKIIGIFVMLGGMGGGILYITNKQKKGLHKKDSSRGIYIITNSKLSKFERR